MSILLSMETAQTTLLPEYTLSPEEEKKFILREYRALMKSLKPKLKPGDKELVRSAFEISADAHKTMRRKSGEPYILHPLAVAQICVDEIGLGVRSTIAALLHDTVEDTDVTLDDIKFEFGDEIRGIVESLTKINSVSDASKSQQAENFKKILVTLANDPRVILIKLADRLHNMRTMDSMKREKQLKISSETSYVYAPLANRMGLYAIKTELEDLCMKYLEADTYKEIAQKLAATKKERTKFIHDFIKPIKEKLEKTDIEFDIYGRPKSIHSIQNKIKTKHVSFEEVYDLFAIRIILDSKAEKEKEDCWKVFGIVTAMYKPSTERMRDWISNPKSNGYEAVHTTVMSHTGRWVEVQIRTKRMDEIADKGLAAHWKYKDSFTKKDTGKKSQKEKDEENRFERWFSQIRESLVQNDLDSVEFLQDFKSSFLVEDIYVYTPKGDFKLLPMGCTALDFAYSIHSKVGDRCIGAKVNHKLVPLGHKLKSGDQVEIITSERQKPNDSWLNMVVTGKAKQKIKDSLRDEKRKIAEDGKYILQRKLEGKGLSYSEENIDTIWNFFKLGSSMELHYRIATKNFDLKDLEQLKQVGDKLEVPKVERVDREPSFPQAKPKSSDYELVIFGEAADKISYQLGKCCNPIAGDQVFGFVTTGKGIVIHRTTCSNAARLMANFGHRIVKTRWSPTKQVSFLTGIRIIGLDDVGVVNKITSIISGECKINIAALSIESKEGMFEGNIKIFVHDKEELDKLANRLLNLEGIEKVERYELEEK
jgi:GTP diphosphokinase / guanosine-3',5'-bis(diphosphate) 3'-diphosphatase